MSGDRRRIGLGARGEALAAQALERLGYRIVERNVRTPVGEIDIVAERGGDWAFVEVRTRRGPGFGRPEESLDRGKRTRMLASAEAYVASHELGEVSWSIDLVAVELSLQGRLLRVEHRPGLEID